MKATRDGWLVKRGQIIKNWKKRWFILSGSDLFYYIGPGGRLQGIIHLDETCSVVPDPECRRQPAFKIVLPRRTYFCVGDSQKDVESWINSIQKVCRPKRESAISLADFDIIGTLGRGSFGKVQLVRYKGNNELYAMKTISKAMLAEYDQVEQTLVEKKALLQACFPFLVSAHFTFQTETSVFMVLDYVPGGELFVRLKDEFRFSEDRTRLYAAEILLGLEHLHKLGFIYRDLKAENILIDKDGHLKITDFGLVKADMGDRDTTTTFCGTPEYIAPEIIAKEPYGMSVDWWSYGILLFEMLTGSPPFYHQNQSYMFKQIVEGDIRFPAFISQPAKELLTLLLNKNPQKRLGTGPKGAQDIREHEFFNGIDWAAVLEKKITPEYVPTFEDETDTTNFLPEYTMEPASVQDDDGKIIGNDTQSAFEDFTCVSAPTVMNQDNL